MLSRFMPVLVPAAGRLLTGLVVAGVVTAGMTPVAAAAPDGLDERPVERPSERRVGAPQPKAPTLRPMKPVVGQRVTVSGRLAKSQRSGHGRARVQLRRTGGWRTVRNVRVRSGNYRATLAAPARATKVRVVFPGRPRLVSRAAPLRVVPRPAPSPGVPPTGPTPPPAVQPTITIRSEGAEIFGAQLDLTGVVLPAHEGRPVQIEERLGATWTRRDAVQTSSTGAWTWPVPTDSTGVRTWRAQTLNPATGDQLISESVSVDLRGLGGAITLGDMASGALPVTVVPTQTVEAVEIYVDEVSVGAAASQPDGSWTRTIATDELDDGEHRVTARLTLGASRGLVASAPFATDAPRVLPEGLSQDTLAAGFDWPTTFEPLDADSALVAEKAGKVWLVDDGVRGAAPVLDLGAEVDTRDDRGLIGLVTHPDFHAVNRTGWVYLAYVSREESTEWRQAAQRVERVHLEHGVAGTRERILGVDSAADCPYAAPQTPDCLPSHGTGHTIGDLKFGPDGSLYVSIGDGVLYWGNLVENGRAQDPDILAGKILRIDPETGLGLPDNPYFEAGDEPEKRNRNRVFAVGLRNPFRMDLQNDGSLLVGDVGNGSWEEISRVAAGDNLGWPCYEGREKIAFNPVRGGCAEIWQQVEQGTDPLVWPIHVYPHPNGLGSVTAGVVLPDSWPADMRGRFLFADYNHQQIRTISLDPAVVNGDSRTHLRGAAAGTPVKFHLDDQDRVWYVSIGSGELRRLAPDDGIESCALGRVSVEWFDGPDAVGLPVSSTCESAVGEGSPPAALAARVHTGRWSVRTRTSSGPLEVAVKSPGLTRVRLNGATLVQSSGDAVDTVVEARVPAGISVLVVEQRFDAAATAAAVTWDQPGTAPTVQIDLPAGAAWVAPGAEFGWAVRAADGQQRDLSRDVELEVMLLHHGENDFHRHQVQTVVGASGTLALMPEHAPGQTVFQLVARVTDDEGRVGTSAPAYVCLQGNRVGVCA